MLSIFFLFTLPLSAQPGAAVLQSPAGAQSHKIQVSDLKLAKKIEAAGGRLIADYGSYRLYETSELTPDMLRETSVELRDNYNTIFLNSGALDTRKAEVKALHTARGRFAGKRMHLVQFAGPVLPEWRDELLGTGVSIISYVPQNTYLIYGDAASIAKAQQLAAARAYIQWDGEFQQSYRIAPSARTVDASGMPREIGTEYFDVQLFVDDAANAATLSLLNQLKKEPFPAPTRVLNYLDVTVRLDASQLGTIAAQPDVVSIAPHLGLHELCERQDQIVAGNLTAGIPNGPGYLAWLASKGFAQSQFTNFVVDLSDTGVDNGTISPAHFGLYTTGNESNASRIVYSRIEKGNTLSNSLTGIDGHGTINAHIIAGYDDFNDFPFVDTNGFHFGLGVCPFVKIGASVIFDSATANDASYNPNFNNVQADAYHDGARISNNSFGARPLTPYDVMAQQFDALVRDAEPTNSSFPTDGNQQMLIVVAAGNDGAVHSIETPAIAKNVITVGAGENVQVIGGPDQGTVGDNEATNAENVASFSSLGPCGDGRIKPDIMAPGTHVSGGVWQATNDLADFPDGIADTNYDGHGVTGGPNGSLFFPTNQQFYTVSTGTSHSTPCVSGGAALVMQYFLNNFTNALPSPAMVKAYLMNSARYMTGTGADDTLPSPNQGMGEMNFGTAFDGVPRILHDQLASDVFTSSGQLRSVTGVVANTNEPFRVTLAWTDAPGMVGSGAALMNNLDLAVTVGGNTYRGNVFNGAVSVTGGSADALNNVESVFLPAGVSGDFLITINGTSINSVGVPNASNTVNQDFALVVYNATAVSRPIVVSAGTELISESCMPTNGVIDPGETVTVDFSLQNIGTSDTTNLVATLLTNNGVTAVSGPQNYGTLTAVGAPVTMPFTFTAEGTCGQTITATLQLQNGATNLGMMNFSFTLGELFTNTTFAQNFDGVSVPALPSGWTTVASNVTQWVTTNDEFDTPPNAAFVPDADSPGLSDLISPVMPIVTTVAQLSFMNNYNLESFPSSNAAPSTGFDGGVLEMQVDGGGFQDIIAAGGSFMTGGYNATIDSSGQNPLAGQMAWSGDSGGFIPTVVALPASAAGHNVQFMWRCGTDLGNPGGGTGWYIDTISLLDGYYACCGPVVAPTILNPQIVGQNITFSFQTVAGQSYTVQWKVNLTDPTWTTLQSFTGNGTMANVSDSMAPPQKFYVITSP